MEGKRNGKVDVARRTHNSCAPPVLGKEVQYLVASSGREASRSQTLLLRRHCGLPGEHIARVQVVSSMRRHPRVRGAHCTNARWERNESHRILDPRFASRPPWTMALRKIPCNPGLVDVALFSKPSNPGHHHHRMFAIAVLALSFI